MKTPPDKLVTTFPASDPTEIEFLNVSSFGYKTFWQPKVIK